MENHLFLKKILSWGLLYCTICAIMYGIIWGAFALFFGANSPVAKVILAVSIWSSGIVAMFSVKGFVARYFKLKENVKNAITTICWVIAFLLVIFEFIYINVYVTKTGYWFLVIAVMTIDKFYSLFISMLSKGCIDDRYLNKKSGD